MEVLLLAHHPGAPRLPFFHNIVSAKTRFWPVSGAPGPKRVPENDRKQGKATGRKAVAGAFMNQSGKLQRVKRPKFRWLRARLSRFSRGWPQKGPFGPFWAPGGLGPIQKRQFGCHAKTAGENGSNPIRLLKCHVRREKGHKLCPRGPSVAGRGPMSTHVVTKKLKSWLNLQRLSQYLS